MIRKYLNNAYFKGGAVFTFASFIANFLNYLFNVLVGRGLGPKGFSEVTTLFSYASLFSVPILVVTLVLIQKVASKGNQSHEYAISVEYWLKHKLKKWWYIWLLLLCVTPIIPGITNLSQTTGYSLIPIIGITFINSFYGALLQGTQAFVWVSLVSLVGVAIKLMGAVGIFLFNDGLFIVTIFLILSGVISIYIAHQYLHAKKNTNTKYPHIQKRIVHVLLTKHLIYTFISILGITALNNMDVVFAKKMFSATDAGFYGAWSLFAKIIMYVIAPLGSISYIYFSNKSKGTNHERLLNLSLMILVVIGLCSYLFYAITPTFIVNLIFGKSFQQIGPALKHAAIFGSLYAGITFVNTYYLAKRSHLSMIVALSIPFLLTTQYIFVKDTTALMRCMEYFSLIIFGLYMLSLLVYNSSHGRK